MMKKIAWILPVVVLMYSCGGGPDMPELTPEELDDIISSMPPEHGITVDNPTGEMVNVTVGEHNFDVDAYDNHYIELDDGDYRVITIVEGDTTVDETVAIYDDGILNPTESRYIKWTDIYVEMVDYDTYSYLLDNEILEIDTNIYYGDFEDYNEVWIPEDWDYGLDAYWPEEITLTGEYVLKSKVYYVDDFEDDYYEW